MSFIKKKNAEEKLPALPAEAEAPAENEAPPVLKMFKLEKLYAVIMDTYDKLVKPITSNWEHIKRRLNGIFTALSLLFFVAYIPLLLFGKISDGLGFGWEIALYVCAGVYGVTLLTMLILTLSLRRVNTAAATNIRKKVIKIVLIIARVASLAIAITVLVITDNAQPNAFNTLSMVVAIVSIVFSLIPLVFGGFGRFFKWLISAPKIKFTFKQVVFEWYERCGQGAFDDRALKKAIKAYGARIEVIINEILVPSLGSKYIKNVSGADILKALAKAPESERNLAEWVVKQTFGYAEGVYVEDNPCDGLELEGDLQREAKIIKQAEHEKRGGVFGKLSSLFKRKSDEAAATDEE